MSDEDKSDLKNILVVDDEVSICRLLAIALDAEGYNPIVYNHPDDALTACKRHTISLAFIDINLPGMSGLELASILKNDDPMCEVVFVTGYGSLDNAVQAIKIGAYDFLKKPISLSEFSLCLRRFEERQILRERIKLAEQRHLQLVQNIPLLIFVLSPDFQLEFINDACLDMLGFTPQEAMNPTGWFLDRIHPDDRDEAKKMFLFAFASGSPVSMECKFLHKDGHEIHVIMKSIPMAKSVAETGDERLEGFIVDISDRVFLEKTLVQREKLKTLGAIAAEVAHEIRNPLVSIGGFAQRLRQKYPNLRECEIILNESERLEKILSRIRNYLEPVDINPKKCTVGAIITDCLVLLSPETEKKQIECKLNLAPGLPFVYADPEVLAQIFINLIRNAAKAMEKGGFLIISAYENDKEIRIDFKNQAPELSVRQTETLFMPFAEGGQSIGLPLCYRLLKDMGGLLSFVQKDDYAIFTVCMPKIDQNRAVIHTLGAGIFSNQPDLNGVYPAGE
ncbi:Response regulator receiver modulated diguanylate cyclase (fragment) [uncultured Desulfobacterium sp.]|uniref:histidine kinase n=1 Tax=uncultured Desulfobacterium sp. TaxID=201089 RepID=A0A445N338_9BACT